MKQGDYIIGIQQERKDENKKKHKRTAAQKRKREKSILQRVKASKILEIT